jgi:hypothetical protein
MGALAAVIPTNNGTTIAGNPVAASDTIDQSLLGSKGAILEIINGGGSPDTVAISDSGVTAAGSAATNPGSSVTNGTNKVFFVEPSQVNPATGLVTVTHTFTTTVTYKLYSLSGMV